MPEHLQLTFSFKITTYDAGFLIGDAVFKFGHDGREAQRAGFLERLRDGLPFGFWGLGGSISRECFCCPGSILRLLLAFRLRIDSVVVNS
jgi:hypothetical protein